MFRCKKLFYLLMPLWALEVPRIVTTYLYYILQTKRQATHITTLLIAKFF